MLKTLYYKNNKLYILNQKLLPGKISYCECKTYLDVTKCIKNMIIRGAPAIGIAAGFGIVLASKQKEFSDFNELIEFLEKARKIISDARPTAVNLFWALERIFNIVYNTKIKSVNFILKKIEIEAKKILSEDIQINKKISMYGEKLFKKDSVVLTHCNAGSLATGGYGTALGVIFSAFKHKKIKMVYVNETRPYLQGTRLTTFELKYNKIPYTLICDNAAGYVIKNKKVDLIIVGADRIALNGDVANKIGTYSLAVLAKYHRINFFVAAPISSIDFDIKTGDEIKIEERSKQDFFEFLDKKIYTENMRIYNPNFDITPNYLVSAIITEKGIIYPPYNKNLMKLKEIL